jgi:hypothetical protein
VNHGATEKVTRRFIIIIVVIIVQPPRQRYVTTGQLFSAKRSQMSLVRNAISTAGS